MNTEWVPFVALLLVGRANAAVSGDDPGKGNSVDGSASDIVRKVIAKGCAKRYTMTCFKMDMVDLVDLLSEARSYQIFPGVAIVKDNATEGATGRKLPDNLIRSLAGEFPHGPGKQLDEYLVGRISDYLSTHSVSLKLLDPHTAEGSQTLNSEVLGAEGRGKNKGHGTLLAGMMMMKGTLLTMGFGALAALAGKALMTGLISLMLSAILGLKSHHEGGHAHKQTTYEIISKPIYSHSHTHSAEIQHNHEHGHAGYSYGRNLEEGTSTRGAEVEYIQLPAKEDDQYGKKMQAYESGKVEYKTISDDDLKNYYGNFGYPTAPNGETKYRKQKSYPEFKPDDVGNGYFLPLTTASPATTTTK